jgi:outer membrane protein
MQTNPAVLSARHAVEVAEANVRLERSGHYPTLDAFASYTDSTNNEFIINDDFGNELGKTALENQDLRYGLRLDVPIYEGGRVTTRTRQAGSLLDAAMQDEEAQRRLTVRQTENAYRAVLAGIEQVQAFRQALVSAQSALEATQAGFEVGTRTIVDVLISEQRYFQAERDNSVARHTYILDHLRLKAAAGMLTKDDLAVVNTLLQ